MVVDADGTALTATDTAALPAGTSEYRLTKGAPSPLRSVTPPTVAATVPLSVTAAATRTRAWLLSSRTMAPSCVISSALTRTPPLPGVSTSVATCLLARTTAGRSSRRSSLLPAAVTRTRQVALLTVL